MDLVKTKKILEIMEGVGILDAGIFAADGKNQIRGITQDKNTIIYTETDQFIEHQVGLLSVKGLLSRLNLFDEEKMGVELETLKSKKNGEDFVNQITIKEGRRRSKVTTTDPANMRTIPTDYPQCETVFSGVISKSYVDYISKMKNSINSASVTDTMYIEMYFDESSDKGTVNFSIGGGYDDFDDKFDVDINDEFDSETFSVKWKIDPVIRAMKQASSISEEEKVEFQVTDRGLLEIDIDGIVVTVAPMNVTK